MAIGDFPVGYNSSDGAVRSSSTSTQQNFDIPVYPVGPQPLSAQQMAEKNQRIYAANQAYSMAVAGAARNEGLERLSAINRRKAEERAFSRTTGEQMRQFGGRGTARAPIVAGRYLRDASEDLRLKYGEIDTELGLNLTALQEMVQKAQAERDSVLSMTELESARLATDPLGFFPAAQMYGR